MSEQIDLETFAEFVAAAALSRHADITDLKFDRKSGQLRWQSGQEWRTISVANYYHSYTKNPTQLDDIIASIFSPDKMPEDPEELKSRLYPHMQDRWTVEEVRLNFEIEQAKNGTQISFGMPHMDIADYFACVLAYDMPDKRLVINSTHSDEWPEGWVAQYDIAYERLIARSHNKWDLIDTDGTTVWMSTWKDGYDAARVLNAGQFETMKLNGYPIVFMPTADSLIVTGSKDFVGQAIAFAMVEAAQTDEAKPLPPIPISIRENTLRKFKPTAINPMRQIYKEAEIHYLAKIYNQQKWYIEQFENASGTENMVADFQIFEDKEQGSYSVCDIFEGFCTIIPETDNINILQKADDGLFYSLREMSFRHFWKNMYHCLEETLDYPKRYKLSRFPNKSELEKILQ